MALVHQEYRRFWRFRYPSVDVGRRSDCPSRVVWVAEISTDGRFIDRSRIC